MPRSLFRLPSPITDKPPQVRRRVPLSLRFFGIFLLLLGGASVVRLLVFIPCLIWDGRFDLVVHVSSSSETIKSITCEPFQTEKQAKTVSEIRASPGFELEAPLSHRAVKVPRFNGDPIEVQVPVSGTEAMCGRALTRTQFQCLLVTGELASGKCITKFVQIPDGRVTREITLELP